MFFPVFFSLYRGSVLLRFITAELAPFFKEDFLSKAKRQALAMSRPGFFPRTKNGRRS